MTTMNALKLPPIKDVKDLFDGLLGRTVEISEGKPWNPGAREPAAVAEYVTDRTVLGALAMTDLKLSIFIGAAMGLLPKGGAEDMIDEVDPTPAVMENLYEVLNVLTSTLNLPNSPHLRITRMHSLRAALPADVSALTASIDNRLDLVIDISGYGKGRLAMILA
jgi:hypothetical protein